jgi:hypothetical protein
LINSNKDIATRFESLQTSHDGKPDGSWHVNDICKDVSKKLDNDKKSMSIMTHDDIATCSDKESSL